MKKFIYISLTVLTIINLFFLLKNYHISYLVNLIVIILVFIQVSITKNKE